jgi:hypothetical protein
LTKKHSGGGSTQQAMYASRLPSHLSRLWRALLSPASRVALQFIAGQALVNLFVLVRRLSFAQVRFFIIRVCSLSEGCSLRSASDFTATRGQLAVVLVPARRQHMQ